MEIPKHIEKALNEIKGKTTKSIWLIGSRANNCAREDSDWDLIVFTEEMFSIRKNNYTNIDIIHVFIDDTFLLDGKPEELRINFSDFCWKIKDKNTAEYLDKKIIEYPEGVALDYDKPRFKREKRNALCLWKNEEIGSV